MNDTYFLYEKGGNLAAFLYGIREKEPIVYKRIIRVIQSIAPYFSLQPVPPKVIIIDEPELGLHPLAIQTLAGMIKSAAAKGTQVIIATQSADLITNFDAEDVITVNQIDGVSVMRRHSSEELNAWLDDYTLGDLWKQNILKGGQPK